MARIPMAGGQRSQEERGRERGQARVARRCTAGSGPPKGLYTAGSQLPRLSAGLGRPRDQTPRDSLPFDRSGRGARSILPRISLQLVQFVWARFLFVWLLSERDIRSDA